jgi:hypothetical protein
LIPVKGAPAFALRRSGSDSASVSLPQRTILPAWNASLEWTLFIWFLFFLWGYIFHRVTVCMDTSMTGNKFLFVLHATLTNHPKPIPVLVYLPFTRHHNLAHSSTFYLLFFSDFARES